MGINVFGPKLDQRKRTSVQVWNRPKRWNREAEALRIPARVFCASLADVFEDAPGPNLWRHSVWELIRQTRWLDWQLLTKRPENIERMLPDDWEDNIWGFYPNVWLGTSIERNEVAERSTILTDIPAWVHFISYEPAIGPGDEIPLEGIEWMIVGGESGPKFRPMDLTWARDMQNRCRDESVAYFFKQNSARRTEMGINALGAIYRDYPATWDRTNQFALT
jgi:protein gp37